MKNVNKAFLFAQFFLGSLGIACSEQYQKFDNGLLGTWAYETNFENGGWVQRVLFFENGGNWKNSNFVKSSSDSDEVFIMESGRWHIEGNFIKMFTLKSTLSFDPEKASLVRLISLCPDHLEIEFNDSIERYTRVVGSPNCSDVH
jgi:hypothetical protein